MTCSGMKTKRSANGKAMITFSQPIHEKPKAGFKMSHSPKHCNQPMLSLDQGNTHRLGLRGMVPDKQ